MYVHPHVCPSVCVIVLQVCVCTFCMCVCLHAFNHTVDDAWVGIIYHNVAKQDVSIVNNIFHSVYQPVII